jgi:ABC-type bacteriocin/lantibiotic exporter with double-glycine peptidase domain
MSTTAPRAGRALLSCVVALVGLSACRLSYTGGARAVNPAVLDRGWLRAAPTPVVTQRRQADCGLAALAMVAGAWGRQVSVDELAREAPPSARGVKLGALRDAARGLGLEAYAISGKASDLDSELRQGRPILVGLVLPLERDRAVTHYEVVVAMNPRDGSVVTLDPATGKHLWRSRAILDAEWKPVGYPTLVVVGDRTTASR